MAGAAAHRQFRLGRYHLDVLARARRCRQRLWPVADAAPNPRQWLVAALVAIWSIRLGLHIAVRTAGITDDPRYAAFAREWGVDSPRRMFVFLQNQGFGSIPLVFAIFVAARFPQATLRFQDYLGALILLIGISGEALADAQLRKFRVDPGQPGPGLRRRSVALVAPSELFLRMVRMARLSGDRDLDRRSVVLSFLLSLGLGELAGAGVHVLDPGARHRHPAARAADAALARRALPATISRAPAGSFRCRRKRRKLSHERRLQNHRHRRTGAAARSRDPRRIQRLCSRTATRLAGGTAESDASFADAMAVRAIAENTEEANAQHYEVPAAFFGHVLGPNRRYSSCFYKEPESTLQEAEEEALRQTVEHADLADGQSILELGCGWGSLSLGWRGNFRNRKSPRCRIRSRSGTISRARRWHAD